MDTMAHSDFTQYVSTLFPNTESNNDHFLTYTGWIRDVDVCATLSTTFCVTDYWLM